MSTAKAQKKPQTVSQEKISKAKEQHQYIKAGVKQNNNVTINGAEKQWQKNPDVIYVGAYRLFGTEEQVREVLTNSGVPAEEQDQAIADAYTKDNTVEGGALHEQFLAEQEAAKSTPKQKAERPKYTQEEILELGKRVGSLSRVKAEKPAKKAATVHKTESGGGGGRRVGSLADRLAALPDGQYLDVSTIKDTGAGSKVLAELPKETGRNKKRAVPGLSLVTSNAEALEKALRLLEYSDADVAKYSQAWKDSVGATLKPVSGPATKAAATKPAPLKPLAKATTVAASKPVPAPAPAKTESAPAPAATKKPAFSFTAKPPAGAAKGARVLRSPGRK